MAIVVPRGKGNAIDWRLTVTGSRIGQNPGPQVLFGQRRCRVLGRLSAQIVIAVAGVVVGQFGTALLSAQESASIHWLTGPRFQNELAQPFPFTNWTYAELRQMLKDVESSRRISIVLDRRLDPSVQFPFDAKNISLLTGLNELAKTANGHFSLPGNFVYLGPESATRRLRTLIEMRKLELQSKEAGIPDRRRSELQRHRTFSWNDLDTPHEILEAIASQFRLTVAKADVIPHDLWAAAALPDVTVIEALSVVLIQFDLTFRWIDSGASIELIPIPEQISVERKHRSKLKGGGCDRFDPSTVSRPGCHKVSVRDHCERFR